MLLLQLAFSGVQTGLLYALTAAGFSLIFGTTRIFHAAHGATFVVAGYAFLLCVTSGLPFTVGIAASVAAAVAFGWTLNALVYRRILRHRGSFFTVFVAAFGSVLVVQSLIELSFGADAQTVSSPLTRSVEIGPDLFVAPIFLIILFVALICLGAVALFLKFSTAGVAMRGLADSPDLMQAFGLQPRRTSSLVFAIGSALAAPPAILTAMTNGLSPAVSAHVMLISLAATIVGGIGSLVGAVAAGLLFGLVESGITAVLDTQWSEAAGFVVLFTFIIIKPSGLFGTRLAL